MSDKPDRGTLANNHMSVRFFNSATSQIDANHARFISELTRVIESEAWRQWVTPMGDVVKYGPTEFRKFLEAKRPMGCQTTVANVRKQIVGTEVEARFEELIGREKAEDAE